MGPFPTMSSLVAVVVLALLFSSSCHAQYITFSAPAADEVFKLNNGGNVTLTWTYNSFLAPESIDLFLMFANKNSIAQTVASGVPTSGKRYEWLAAETTPPGRYWIAATESGRATTLADVPKHAATVGDRTIALELDLCTNHTTCAGARYCDLLGACWSCDFCDALDAIDGSCPSKCGTVVNASFAPLQFYPAPAAVPTQALAEIAVVGAVQAVVTPGCVQYDNLVVSSYADVAYSADTAGAEPHRMSKRLDARLGVLSTLAIAAGLGTVTVRAAYQVAPAGLTAATVTHHHDGRAADVRVGNTQQLGLLALKAVEAGFDFVAYEQAGGHVHVSVLPDPCSRPLDLVFLLDGSASIDEVAVGNFHNLTLGFVSEVVSRFDISPDKTRVGVATFASGVETNFFLDAFSNEVDLQAAIAAIPYPAGATFTSEGLRHVREVMFTTDHGMRDVSAGVARVLIVLTDGQATPGFEPAAEATLLQGSVSAFAMGVGKAINVTQLQEMASGSNNTNVYIVKSFARIAEFVDKISAGTCAANTLVTAGVPTTTFVEDCQWLFFTPSCPVATGLSVHVRTLSGIIAVYLSRTTSQPGPLDNSAADETDAADKTLVVTRAADDARPVYIAVHGVAGDSVRSQFLLEVWSDLFAGAVTATAGPVPENAALGSPVFTPILVRDVGGITMAPIFSLDSVGNEDARFTVDADTGVISLAGVLDYETKTSYNLTLRWQDAVIACLAGGLDITVTVGDVNDNVPYFVTGLPSAFDLTENTTAGTVLGVVEARDVDSHPVLTFSLTGTANTRRGRRAAAPLPFAIDPATAALTVSAGLDAETAGHYTLVVTVADEGGFSATKSLAVAVAAVPCGAAEYSATGTFPCTNDPRAPCTAAQYLLHDTTATSARACPPLTVCALWSSYETTAPTPTSNRVCTAVTVCSADENETAVPTLVSNRVCAWIDDCAGGPCLHGGTCVDGVRNYTCSCAGGWLGATCDTVDYCFTAQCGAGAVCVNGETGALCMCAPGRSCACCDCLVGAEPPGYLNTSVCVNTATGGNKGFNILPVAVGAAAGAALLVVLVVLIVLRRRRQKQQQSDDKETGGSPSRAVAAGVAAIKTPLPLLTPNALYARILAGGESVFAGGLAADGPWNSFWRVVSFDALYHGNAPLAVPDHGYVAVYKNLGLPSPMLAADAATLLPSLRALGALVLHAQPFAGAAGVDAPATAGGDAAVDFVAMALADMLVEVAIDAAALAHTSPAYAQSLPAAFYHLIDDYAAGDNPYLRPLYNDTTGCRAGFYEDPDAEDGRRRFLPRGAVPLYGQEEADNTEGDYDQLPGAARRPGLRDNDDYDYDHHDHDAGGQMYDYGSDGDELVVDDEAGGHPESPYHKVTRRPTSVLSEGDYDHATMAGLGGSFAEWEQGATDVGSGKATVRVRRTTARESDYDLAAAGAATGLGVYMADAETPYALAGATLGASAEDEPGASPYQLASAGNELAAGYELAAGSGPVFRLESDYSMADANDVDDDDDDVDNYLPAAEPVYDGNLGGESDATSIEPTYARIRRGGSATSAGAAVASAGASLTGAMAGGGAVAVAAAYADPQDAVQPPTRVSAGRSSAPYVPALARPSDPVFDADIFGGLANEDEEHVYGEHDDVHEIVA